jgi:hypothetical protein
MSDHGHEHDGAYAKGEQYEPDMEGPTMGIIWIYTVVLSVIFFATVFALYPYFRWERDQEMSMKVYTVPSAELDALRAEEDKAVADLDKAKKAALEGLKN